MPEIYGQYFSPLNAVLFSLVIIWSLAWKGVALWKSAQAGHKIWFVALFLINTVGILEIIYIFWFNKLDAKRNR